ncbi:MAG TPA: ISL3 family transposase [Dyella sp.]|uniref:ISL3 family transposase n=1 Tax=Dyella sp. TaxID=1869338 RepID=UPI002D781E7C|nr:ISL3 family transposase [Dyella sp.]HET6553852.1 ISL3 family transposase [Dyella sp.]
MLDRKTIEALGGWEGYRLERVVWPEGSSRTVSLYLKPKARVMHCAHCGARCKQIHETTVRRVRDLPFFEFRVVLHVPRRRVWCERCGGPRLEKLSWLGRYQRVTDRLAEAVSQLLLSSNIQAVARFFQLGWHTVKAIDKALLRSTVHAPDWSQIHYLAMDEFALHKGHRYATVVVDPIRRQVLWLGLGRSRDTAKAFFEQLPAGIAQQIRAVAIDMTTAYELEIRAHCPQAEVVFDLFHVVAKYGRDVIDRVRVDQANHLRQDRPARRVIKSSRWLLLRNRDNLEPRQAVQLKELLQANQPLLSVYLMRDELKRLWFYRRPAWARQAWKNWCEQALRSGIGPLTLFAQRLQAYQHGILSRCRHPLNTSIVEGINNTIKVIKRRAYGYRDQEYFFLKIRAAFPGNSR